MAGLGFQITSLKFSSNESVDNHQEQTLSEDLLKDLDYNILYLNFSKLLLFLENNNTSEICFPFISKHYQDIFKRIALDVNVLKSKSLDANYRYICNKILDTVNSNKYVYMLEYVHEQRKEFNNVLVLKKIYLKNDVTIPPLCISSSSRSLDSLEDSQSSMDESNEISRSNTPGSVNKNFKRHCLKTALAFVKNDDIKRIEFPNLNLEQHKFLHTLLISVVAYAEFDSNFGAKDLYRALWEAVKIYSLKYYFRVKTETGGDKKSLVFLKLPKSTPDSDKTSKKNNNKKVESNTKLTKKQKKTVKMNNIKLLVENLRPSLITDTLNKVIYLLSDEQQASCIFQPKNEQESEFYSSVLLWARKMLTRPIFSEQDGCLFDRIAELLNQAKCNVVTGKKSRRNNKTEFRQITYIKKPKFASFSKSRNKSNKEKQLLEGDRVNSDGSINNPTKKKNKSKKEKKIKEKDKMTSESSASSDVSVRKKSKYEEQIKSNSSDMSKDIQIQRNLHFFNFLSKKAKKKLRKKLSLQQLTPAVQQPVEPVRQSEKIEALLPTPNTITNKLMKIDFKPASSKTKSVMPDIQDSGGTSSTSVRCSQDKKQEFTVKTIADIPKHVRDAIPERFRLTTVGTENSRCGNDKYQKSQLMEGLQVPVHSEKAMRMMKGMGWSGGALGVRGNGITEPLMPVLDTIKGRGFGHVDSKITIKPKNISTTSLLGEYKPNMSTTSLLGEYNPNILSTISLLGAYRTYSMWKKINYEVNIPNKPKPPSTTSLAAEKVTAKQKICTWNICNFVNKLAIESKTLSTTSFVEEINTSNSIEEKSKLEQKDITKSESISTSTLLVQEVNKSNSIEENGNFEEKLTDNSNTISILNNVEEKDATEPKFMPPTTSLAEEKASSKSNMCTWNICNFVNEVNEAATKSKTASTSNLVEEVHKSNIIAEKNNFEKLKSISTPSLVDEEFNKSNSTWKNSYLEKDATELKTLSTNSLVEEKVTTKSMSIWNISNFANKVATNDTNTKTVSTDSLVEEPQDKKDDYVEEKVDKKPKAVSKAIDLEEKVVTELKIVSEASHVDEQVATKPKAIEEIVIQQEIKDGTQEKYSKSESKCIFDESDLFDITPTPRMETDVIIAKTNELLKDNYTFGNLMKLQNPIQSFRQKLLMGMLELLSSNETTKVLKYESTINKKNRNFLVNATNALGHRERINLSSMQQCYADAIYKKYMELPGVIITGRLCNDNEILLTKTITKEDENSRLEAWVSQVTETNMETFIQSLETTCLTKKNFNDLKFRILILLKILFFLKTDDDDLDVAFYSILPERKRQHIQAVVEDVNLRLLFGNSRCERRVTLEISKYIKDTYLGMMFSHDFTAFNLTKFTFNKRSER